jgi:predicted TIM-barrel fold metal-dependent hydrolase
MIIDMHVHTGGVGYDGTGCWMSEKTRHSIPFTVLRLNLGIRKREMDGDLDGRLRELLYKHIDEARLVDAAVVFAHDRIYGEDGRVREKLMQIYTPNDYVLRLAKERPGRILAAASVHPYRPDALEELDRVIAAGAVAVKWLPNSQGIDPGDARLDRFYGRLADAKIPLICHTGGEHTVRVIEKRFSGLQPLERPLSIGALVVAAHSGTRSGLFDEDSFDEFVAMTRRWPKLYGDLSAWSAPNRVRHYKRLLQSGINWDQVLHGSDYPVPAMPWCFIGRLAPYSRDCCSDTRSTVSPIWRLSTSSSWIP